MRAQEFEHLEGNQRYLLRRLKRLDKLEPADVLEETKVADAMSRASDAFNRTSERKAKLYGWEPEPKKDPNITNNNLILVGSNEAGILKMLSRELPKELLDGEGQTERTVGEPPVFFGKEILADVSANASGSEA